VITLVSYVVIIISLFIVVFNIWSVIRKHKRLNGRLSFQSLIEKNIIINMLAVLLGIYFILMVLGQFLLLKLVIFFIGLMFVSGSLIEIFVNSAKLKKGGSLLFFIIKTAFSVVMLTLGIIFVIIFIAAIRV
jgi:hypothetical protein